MWRVHHLNDAHLLKKLFDDVTFTHVMHLAAQAGVRYTMKNPSSYIHSNIAGLVSVRGLQIRKSTASNCLRTLFKSTLFRKRSNSAATKKAGEEIAHTYNHIYGLSITGLRFFTVYGPWGRPDMAYFFFARDILKGKAIQIFEGPDHTSVARDFTYIDDIVKGCLGTSDTAQKSTGSGGIKKGAAQFRIYNLVNPNMTVNFDTG